jgi:hypothetical protein
MRGRKAGLAAMLAVSVSMPVVAGERIQIKGSYGGYDKSQVLELGKDHILIGISNEGVGYILDPPHNNTPMQHAAGPCAGSIEINAGKASGNGYCVRTNPAGGKWVLHWDVHPDTSKGVTGRWEMSGVEGNTLGWKGGGTWGPSTDTGSGRFVNHFVGWLEKP